MPLLNSSFEKMALIVSIRSQDCWRTAWFSTGLSEVLTRADRHCRRRGRSDAADGLSMGVQGTPTFYFEGERLEPNRLRLHYRVRRRAPVRLGAKADKKPSLTCSVKLTVQLEFQGVIGAHAGDVAGGGEHRCNPNRHPSTMPRNTGNRCRGCLPLVERHQEHE